ncbi:MAG: hypothetical protein ACOY4H_14075 [Thermodesulfobacteriota bacterium]
MKKPINTPYSPLYFLAALGNGGLTVAFFIFRYYSKLLLQGHFNHTLNNSLGR